MTEAEGVAAGDATPVGVTEVVGRTEVVGLGAAGVGDSAGDGLPLAVAGGGLPAGGAEGETDALGWPVALGEALGWPVALGDALGWPVALGDALGWPVALGGVGGAALAAGVGAGREVLSGRTTVGLPAPDLSGAPPGRAACDEGPVAPRAAGDVAPAGWPADEAGRPGFAGPVDGFGGGRTTGPSAAGMATSASGADAAPGAASSSVARVMPSPAPATSIAARTPAGARSGLAGRRCRATCACQGTTGPAGFSPAVH